MRIAVLQATGNPDDPEANFGVLADAAAEASRCDLLVTPELFLPGYAPARVHRQDGADQRAAIAELSRRHHLHIVASTVEHDGDAHYISATLTGPDGTALLHYRKAHLFGAECDVFTAGRQRSASVRIRGIAVALAICFDVEFPEYVRALADDGAELLAVPTAVPARSGHQADAYDSYLVAERIIPTRAMESTIAIAYANHSLPAFTGASRIVGPNGSVLATASRGGTDLLMTRIDAATIPAARAALPYLTARQADLYTTTSGDDR